MNHWSIAPSGFDVDLGIAPITRPLRLDVDQTRPPVFRLTLGNTQLADKSAEPAVVLGSTAGQMANRGAAVGPTHVVDGVEQSIYVR